MSTISIADRVFACGRAVLVLAALLVSPHGDAQKPCAVQSTWREQQRTGFDGTLSYRCTFPLDADARLAARRNDLGVLVGPAQYGGYEVLAGGRPIGRSRGFESALPFGFPSVFRIPSSAVGAGGTVTLDIRVHRIGWVSDADRDSGPVDGRLMFGAYPALGDRIRVEWDQRLWSEIPLLILAALFAISALHHLLLFSSRDRRQVEHLWFGLLALVFALNTFASTYWIYEITPSRAIAARIADMTGHLAAALAIQFLWTFFWRRIPMPLRAYQLSHVAFALFVAFWPDLHLVMTSGIIRWLWLLPLLVIAALFVLYEGWRGAAEARLIAAGGVAMVAIEGVELARHLFGLQLGVNFSVAGFGFGAVILAMSLAVSLRFRHVRDELEELRFRLEDQVRERTRELAAARDDAVAGLRVKSEFLANISHEIRTPMNGVIGVAELLGRTPLTMQQRAHLQSIEVSGRSLLALLDDIIDYSRLESNTLTLERSPFRIRSVVDDCIEIMRPVARGKGLALASSIADGTIPAIAGDQQRTRRVLLNLLSNAIKFTASGRVELCTSSRTLDDGRIEVRFSVTDTGRGIAREDQDRLFVAFQQLDGSSTRKHGGAGLGLAISKRLAELMGGTIEVESAPGRGSTFQFTIVGERAEMAPHGIAETSPQSPPKGRRSLRVLLAEDDQVNQIVILDMLEQLGHHADPVGDGLEALDALERNDYDVVLMDVQMPGLDGFEVTRRIRGTMGDRIRIIALTAHALAGDRERCLAAGMNDYLSKPVRMADVERVLA